MTNEQGAKNRDKLYAELQRRVIGSLLYNSEDANRALELLVPEDFEEPSLEVIFTAVTSIARRNEPVTAVTIAEELELTGQLATVGGTNELYLLRDAGEGFLLEAPLEVYARMVKESSAKAKVGRLLREYHGFFKDDSGMASVDAIAELQNALNAQLYNLADESTSAEMSDDYDEYLDLLSERERVAAENDGAAEGLQGIPSLLPSINHYTTGWLPGQLVTIGARTGVGKSVFAVNSAVAAAQAGKSVLFFSLEMGAHELMDRIVASSTGVLLNKLRQGGLTDEDKAVLKDAESDLRAMKIKIETEAKVTIDSIRAKALKQAQTPNGLDFIVVDYLQLVTPVGRYSSRQEAVADISRNMKLLAKQLNVPVMVLVQVNREGKEDENPVPKLSQIRESGAIAQDSDIVILLHRDESMDDTVPHTLVLLEKNRNGEAQKTVRCHSNLECSLFREIVRSKDVDRLTEDEQHEAINDLGMDDFGALTDDANDFFMDDDEEIF